MLFTSTSPSMRQKHTMLSAQLTELPGDHCLFKGTDAGEVVGLKCPALKEAFFKEGAPIISLSNINDQLHNGTQGTFKGKDGGNAMIEVDG